MLLYPQYVSSKSVPQPSTDFHFMSASCDYGVASALQSVNYKYIIPYCLLADHYFISSSLLCCYEVKLDFRWDENPLRVHDSRLIQFIHAYLYYKTLPSRPKKQPCVHQQTR